MAFWPLKESDYVKEDMSIEEYPDCDDYKDIYKYAFEMTEREAYQAAEGLYHNLK